MGRARRRQRHFRRRHDRRQRSLRLRRGARPLKRQSATTARTPTAQDSYIPNISPNIPGGILLLEVSGDCWDRRRHSRRRLLHRLRHGRHLWQWHAAHRRRGHRPDLRQNDDGILRDRHAPCRVRHHNGRKRLPALPAERIRAGCFRAGRRAARARALIPATIKHSKSEGRVGIPRFLFCFFTARTARCGFLPQGAAPRLGPHRRQNGTHTALSS